MDHDTPLGRRVPGTTRRRFLQRTGLAGIGAAGLIATASLSGLAKDKSPSSTGGHAGHGKSDSLRDAMRRLWEDHIAWTRLFIISFAAGLDDTELVAGRLLRNQDEIGDLFRPVFGAEVAETVAALLRDHILGAAAILEAATQGAGVEEAIDAWYANGDDIARALSELNPQHWPFEEMQTMMRAHLDITLEEGVARLEGRFADDIAIWDAIHDQALEMTDMLTEGLQRAPRRRRVWQ